jgi:hypothetical protein
MRKLIATLLVLAALLVAADLLARRVAEDRLAQYVQQTESLTQAPEVDIAGTPFLTQAARGEFEQVTVRSPVLAPPGQVPLREVRARMSGVAVPLREALTGQFAQITVDQLRVDATAPYSDIAAALTTRLEAQGGAQLSDVTIEPGEGEEMVVSGRLGVAGAQVDLRLPVRLSVDGEELVLTPGQADNALPGAARSSLGGRFPIPELPYGLKLASVVPRADGLVFSAVRR